MVIPASLCLMTISSPTITIFLNESSTLAKGSLNLIPPASVYPAWKKDYETMQQEMIYGDSVPFEQMIEALRSFNKPINGN